MKIMLNLLLLFTCFPFFVCANIPTDTAYKFVKAPHQCTIKKCHYKKRYGDITTSGYFLVYRIEFSNKDTKSHSIDYPCFYLSDTGGTKYQVHQEATIVRQTKYEDWKIKDIDVIGLNRKVINAQMKTQGFLVFEVPEKKEYQLKFHGYLD